MKISIIYHSETGNVSKMAELVMQGCLSVEGAEAKSMSIYELDNNYIEESKAVIFGSPTYDGTCSWQLKRYLDSHPTGIIDKLGGVFISQNWPGGGGASFAAMTVIAAMLVNGMVVYSGGVYKGTPFLHFGAVSEKAPSTQLFKDRCLKLGENIAKKALGMYVSKTQL